MTNIGWTKGKERVGEEDAGMAMMMYMTTMTMMIMMTMLVMVMVMIVVIMVRVAYRAPRVILDLFASQHQDYQCPI